MKLVFAYECYPDGEVFRFLRTVTRIPMQGFHGFGQGDVVNALLVKKTATFGMVDEDPRSTHHPLRDGMEIVQTTDDFELRKSGGRYLAIVRPELEEAFLRAARLVGSVSPLPEKPNLLRRAHSRPESPAHDLFVNGLHQVYEQARAHGRSNFLTQLVAAIAEVRQK